MPRRHEVLHATEIVVIDGPTAAPDDIVRVGDPFAISVRIDCASGCRLGSRTLEIRGPDGSAHAVEIVDGRATAIDLVASTKPGRQTWTLSYAPAPYAPAGQSVPSHAAVARAWSYDIAPHTASLAVWGVPDTIPAGQPVTLTVGATSTAGLVLAGRTLEIRNALGEVLARPILGKAPWPGTTALLWAEVHSTAPPDPGIATWTAHLVADELALAHEAVDCTFTLPIAAPPDHRIDVEVLEAVTGVGVPEALVRIGSYRATTDENGRATLHVPKGSAEIVFWKTGYDAPDHPIEIDAHTSVTIVAAVVPEEDPDAHWKG